MALPKPAMRLWIDKDCYATFTAIMAVDVGNLLTLPPTTPILISGCNWRFAATTAFTEPGFHAVNSLGT